MDTASEIAQVEKKLLDKRKIVQSWFHSRKALLLLVSFTIATVALFVNKMNGDQWITFAKWSIASYMAANVADGAVGGFCKTPPDSEQ